MHEVTRNPIMTTRRSFVRLAAGAALTPLTAPTFKASASDRLI